MATEQWRNANPDKVRASRRKWYANNRQHAKDKINERLDLNKKWYRELKSTMKCEECGNSHPAVLTFHHIDPSEKDKDVCMGVCDGWGQERVLKEISKCKVLCRNCHAILHWDENQ